MSRERLFERLIQAEMPIGNVSALDQLKNSIIRHLTGLLNTRQGSVPQDPDYGIPDLCNVAGSFAAGTSESIVSSIMIAMNRYEPRLISPVMRSLEETKEVITLRYKVSASVTLNDEVKEAFSFFVKINSAGRVYLEAQGGL